MAAALAATQTSVHVSSETLEYFLTYEDGTLQSGFQEGRDDKNSH
jgi:hypothetical protein